MILALSRARARATERRAAPRSFTQVLTKLELNNRVQIALLAHDAGLDGTSAGEAAGP